MVCYTYLVDKNDHRTSWFFVQGGITENKTLYVLYVDAERCFEKEMEWGRGRERERESEREMEGGGRGRRGYTARGPALAKEGPAAAGIMTTAQRSACGRRVYGWGHLEATDRDIHFV